ncbi:MAG: glycerol-3-phosphate dehydrogenase [Pedobacter sp.]|nr:MAG: glycerol-3-phosphate dehydrogenase [Pedobacter sp.]
MQDKIAMIGGGSWATAIIKMLNDNNTSKEIFWWMRNESAIHHIQTYKHNPNYLSSVEIKLPPENVSLDMKYIVQAVDYLILNVPAAFLKETLKEITASDLKGKKIISAIKGIVPDENLIVGDYLQQAYQIPAEDILVISGPCHSEEVALEKLSYLTIACKDLVLAERFANMLSTRYIKTNISDDIYGTEYAAVLKNIYAVASGICHGLGYGDNFQAVLISNAIREMESFVEKIYPIHRDIKESAYLGDLLVTAYSQFSRNRTFGNMIGKGYTVKSAQLEMNMVAEGYYATQCMHFIREKYDVTMPILEAVYHILYKQESPQYSIKSLENILN